jgi:hypothetical protein
MLARVLGIDFPTRRISVILPRKSPRCPRRSPQTTCGYGMIAEIPNLRDSEVALGSQESSLGDIRGSLLSARRRKTVKFSRVCYFTHRCLRVVVHASLPSVRGVGVPCRATGRGPRGIAGTRRKRACFSGRSGCGLSVPPPPRGTRRMARGTSPGADRPQNRLGPSTGPWEEGGRGGPARPAPT